MRRRALVATMTTMVFVVATSTSLAGLSLQTGGNVKVRITYSNNGQDVTNGGVAGRGHFTASGAITDTGAATIYRTQKGSLPALRITLRFVTVGKKGTITYVDKIDTSVGTSLWTITSATRAYKGLHGQGKEYENSDHTLSILKGTVSR